MLSVFTKTRNFVFWTVTNVALRENAHEELKLTKELLLVTAGKRMDIYPKVCLIVAVVFLKRFFFYFIALCRFV